MSSAAEMIESAGGKGVDLKGAAMRNRCSTSSTVSGSGVSNLLKERERDKIR
jgi:hypothetical protein